MVLESSQAAEFLKHVLQCHGQGTAAFGSVLAGDHGFTRGRYTLVRTSPDGGETVLGRGNYLSIWRRESDGWRVILDTRTEERKEATESTND